MYYRLKGVFLNMNIQKLTLTLAALFIMTVSATAQNLEGGAPGPNDPDVDMYMASWQESMPTHTHGSLIERAILSRGDALSPPRRGAVLKFVKRFTHGSLAEKSSTTPTTLSGEQEVFYIISGEGTIHWKGKSESISEGCCILIPEGLEFSMKNSGSGALTMYVIVEETPEGFNPVKDIVIRSNNKVPFNTNIGHWSYQEKDLLLGHHGLAELHAVITLTLKPMSIGHPHFHVEGTEEAWTTISGDNIAWLGKEIRTQAVGTAYMIPPDGRTNHSNINKSMTEPVVMLYFAVRNDLKR